MFLWVLGGLNNAGIKGFWLKMSCVCAGSSYIKKVGFFTGFYAFYRVLSRVGVCSRCLEGARVLQEVSGGW